MKKITVTGNVGKDPEVRYAPNGDSFTVFSLAVTSDSKDKKKTDWFEVNCSGKTADVVNEHMRKGTRLLIEGSPSINAWVSRDGKPMGVIRIFASYIEFIGAKPQDEESEESTETSDEVSDEEPTSSEPEDIPFS